MTPHASSLAPSQDDWLTRWLPLVCERAGADPVLEIGCGTGADTATLAAAGLRVVAFDLSTDAVAVARQRVPQADIHCQDVRSPFPLDSTVSVVIASLSLHYFAWDETLGLIARIHDTLRPRGVFLCRLNSTEDHHYGASGYPVIDRNYYRVDGEAKRFFSEDDLSALFAEGWQRLAQTHYTTGKYAHPKALWEIILERSA